MKLDDATHAQNDAASPETSTWLSANAGSGKTRVLTDRVARLLLRGADPQSILCLTYTKAAAGEMQNRLFKGLGTWAMLPDADLRNALAAIGETPPDDLSHARTLFARAVEAPGGLKIQTIHSFCSALLRQFPLEAGVSPGFRELDERAQADLIDRVLDDLAKEQAEALHAISRQYSGDSLVSLAQAVISARTSFETAASASELARIFDVSDGLTIEGLVDETLTEDDLQFLRDASLILLAQTSPTDRKLGALLAQLPSKPSLSVLETLEGPFLYGGKTKNPFGAKTGTIPTNGTRDGPFAPYLSAFNNIVEKIAEARPHRVALVALEHTAALHAFAQQLLPAYALEKERHGALDFDDLIARAGTLLSDRSYDWVLYRLDGRIDHILVDEAQDTSPAQWAVIGALAQEIAAGEGTRAPGSRSFFVVGDKKQSIYSFQGADARAFDAMADHFKYRMKDGMARRELLHSFRSSPAILHTVDCTFDGEGQDALGPKVEHRAFYPERPGRVDLWPLQERDEAERPPAWYDPVDRVSTGDPTVLLADKLAQSIKAMIQSGTIPDGNGGFRRISAGDVLILVQRRSQLFDQIIRACKALDLPMAGADRLKISAALAVKDLTALLSFLALPEDDLSLAAALRSPLFGWDERDLFGLAAGRGTAYLWAALRSARARFPKTVERLDALRRIADYERPFELLETILSRFGGRKQLVARLGHEAEDGIDELLAHALRYEQRSVPSLTGFLAELASEELEIKRATDTSDGLIQVMTIHGAKGLERPIVVLPDTVRGDPKGGGDFVITGNGLPVWPEAADRAPDIVRAAIEAARAAEREERQRLLYVAMTRAKCWLIVAGLAPGRSPPTRQWHEMVEDGLTRAGATWITVRDQPVFRFETGTWQDISTTRDDTKARPEDDAIDPWVPAPLLPAESDRRTLSPSDLGGAKALPGEGGQDEDKAKSKGTAIHVLLEHLPNHPTDRWSEIGERLLRDTDSAELIEAFVQEAGDAILAHPGLFASGTLTEVDITADMLALGGRLDGTLDRVIIDGSTIEIVDYKTNALVPDTVDAVPEGLLRQLGAYLEAARRIWPDKDIRLTILWTADATAMTVPHDLVTAAVGRAAKP